MAWEKETGGKDVTYVSEDALAEKYVCVIGGTAQGTCRLPVNAVGIANNLTTDVVLGVAQQTCSANHETEVRVSGQSKAVANEAITLYSLVGAVITTGRIAMLTGDGTWSTTDAKPVGQALEAASAGGEIITIQTKLSS